MKQGTVWEGVTVHENGSISDNDAKIVRKRLRVLITADVQALADIVEGIQALQNRLSTLATMEFAVEDLTDPEKEVGHDAEGTVGQSKS